MDNKDVITNQTSTTLIEVKPTVEQETVVLTVDKPIKISPPLVLLFAEYYGYVSPLLDWATEMASGKDIDPIKKKLIKLDAKIISDKMKSEEPIKDLREDYIMLHEIIFSKYERILKQMTDYDDLPF